MPHATSPPPDRCPRGCATAGRLKLLTSMTRYYVCDECHTLWNVPRPAVTGGPTKSPRPRPDKG